LSVEKREALRDILEKEFGFDWYSTQEGRVMQIEDLREEQVIRISVMLRVCMFEDAIGSVYDGCDDNGTEDMIGSVYEGRDDSGTEDEGSKMMIPKMKVKKKAAKLKQ
jgi:hypothetical protein